MGNVQKNLLINLNHGPMGLFFRLTGLQVPGWMVCCAQHALLLGASYEEVSRECNEAGLPSSRWFHAMFERDADPPEHRRERLAAMYDFHNNAIRKLVPPEQLLEFNVKQGFAPLCL